MSDDAQTPEAPGEAAAGGFAAPGGSGAAASEGEAARTSLDKGPSLDTGASFDKGTSLDTGASFDKPGGAAPGAGAAAGAVPQGGQSSVDPWAPPVSDGQSRPGEPAGPGYTLASNDPPGWAAPSVHDQRTVTSMPSSGAVGEPRDAVPGSPWVNPSPAPHAGAPGVGGSGGDPFAPPGATPGNPFVPPTASVPYAAHGEPVPLPPIAPDGPGQVPYGYPGGPGYPAVGGPGGPGYPVPGPGGPGYYGWPGMQPLPSNGMGTAGLVLGIISAVIFCLWPVAIVVGVLAVIFGAVGRGKARRGEATNPGQALAGIICGVAGVALGVGLLVLLVATGA